MNFVQAHFRGLKGELYANLYIMCFQVRITTCKTSFGSAQVLAWSDLALDLRLRNRGPYIPVFYSIYFIYTPIYTSCQ